MLKRPLACIAAPVRWPSISGCCSASRGMIDYNLNQFFGRQYRINPDALEISRFGDICKPRQAEVQRKLPPFRASSTYTDQLHHSDKYYGYH
jgi:hypothetical protein